MVERHLWIMTINISIRLLPQCQMNKQIMFFLNNLSGATGKCSFWLRAGFNQLGLALRLQIIVKDWFCQSIIAFLKDVGKFEFKKIVFLQFADNNESRDTLKSESFWCILPRSCFEFVNFFNLRLSSWKETHLNTISTSSVPWRAH